MLRLALRSSPFLFFLFDAASPGVARMASYVALDPVRCTLLTKGCVVRCLLTCGTGDEGDDLLRMRKHSSCNTLLTTPTLGNTPRVMLCRLHLPEAKHSTITIAPCALLFGGVEWRSLQAVTQTHTQRSGSLWHPFRVPMQHE